MPIRTKPFDQIEAADVEALRARGVRESRTLEFKRDLNLGDRDERGEFLKDVTAFANASGGTLVYGVAEGTGEQQGMIVDLPGLTLEAEKTHQLIDSLLYDGTDERIMGVLHRAIPRVGGLYYYVVRVPPSPLAPHMVTQGKQTNRFYLRSNTTNAAMDARQIKEVALRASSAEERALSVIERRRVALIHRAGHRKNAATNQLNPYRDQFFLHVVPLFPNEGGWNFTDEAVERRLRNIRILGYYSSGYLPRYAPEGLYVGVDHKLHVAFLRSGAIEFQAYDITEPAMTPAESVRAFTAWEVTQAVLLALDDCESLTADGLLPLPALVSLGFSGVERTRLKQNPRDHSGLDPLMEESIMITPTIIHAWDQGAGTQIRRIFDEMHQAWGVARWRSHDSEEKRIWWLGYDRVAPPESRPWRP